MNKSKQILFKLVYMTERNKELYILQLKTEIYLNSKETFFILIIYSLFLTNSLNSLLVDYAFDLKLSMCVFESARKRI